MGHLGMLLRIALTSLVSHKVKSLIVGAIMIFGTLLVVLGTSLLDSVERSMEESVTSSLAGHLQIHAASAKDKLELFGGMGGPNADIGTIQRFEALRGAVSEVENVEAVVPMGLGVGVSNTDGELDTALKALRKAVRAEDAGARAVLEERVRQILALYREEVSHKLEVQADTARVEEERAQLEEALSPAFWSRFEADPLAGLEFLDTKVAPSFGGGRALYLRYLGTDIPLFADTFDRFEVVKGAAVAPGQRGFMIADRTYERQVKHRVAMEFDEVHRAVTEAGRQIAGDAILEFRVERMVKQYRRVLFQLQPADAAALEDALRRELPDVAGGLPELLQAFLRVDDATVVARYAFFYREIAPKIRLYDVQVGDVITLTSFTRTGYVRSVNVRFTGTFTFRGLESADLAGVTNLVDLVTFRQLYGAQTDAQREELATLREEVSAANVDRAGAEDALFGGDDAVEEAAPDGAAQAQLDAVRGGELEVESVGDVDAPFAPEEVQQGLVLNAAVVLKDPSRLEETRAAVQAAAARSGLEVKVLDWQESSGLVGQFVLVVRLVLWVAIGIIFTVALVIINNSMVMATMERTAEIGTMRALGAQRGFVVALFLVETVALGLLAGAVGGGLGVGLVAWMGSAGIPASNEVLVFLFGGPRLYPSVGWENVGLAVGIILGVSLVSTLYPAVLAARIQPVVAMQSR